MLKIGSLIDGKYKVLSEIGHGGMSVVYMAINEKANKTWAIKEVRKDGIKDFEVVRQGLVVETEMLKRLSHPNLPSIIDVIENEDNFLIVMDYIEGNPLSKSLEEFGAQPQDYVIDWAKQLCDVLGYLHTRTPAIIYRDMKPANIMLKPDGNVTLIDFGTAREFKEKNLADTTCLGTVGYAAPEQFGGMGQTDARTDIYCLGATLYHLVTGCNPCEPPYEILPIRSINPQLSSGLERIIIKCTQRNPEDRYQSCAELMYALEHYEEIDDKYRKQQKKKLKIFMSSVAMVLACLIGALSCNLAEAKNIEKQYKDYVGKANKVISSDEKTAYLAKAIDTGYDDSFEAWNDLLLAIIEDKVFLMKSDGAKTIAEIVEEKKGLDEVGVLTAKGSLGLYEEGITDLYNRYLDKLTDDAQKIAINYYIGQLFFSRYAEIKYSNDGKEDKDPMCMKGAVSASEYFKQARDLYNKKSTTKAQKEEAVHIYNDLMNEKYKTKKDKTVTSSDETGDIQEIDSETFQNNLEHYADLCKFANIVQNNETQLVIDSDENTNLVVKAWNYLNGKKSKDNSGKESEDNSGKESEDNSFLKTLSSEENSRNRPYKLAVCNIVKTVLLSTTYRENIESYLDNTFLAEALNLLEEMRKYVEKNQNVLGEFEGLLESLEEAKEELTKIYQQKRK